MNKTIVAIALLVLTFGCAIFPTGSTLKVIAQTLALTGTSETVRHQPKTKPKFELTAKSLDALVASGSSDPVALQNALTNLPISEFHGTNGQIIVAEGAIIINFLAHDVIQIDTRTNAVNKYVAPLTLGLRDGIRQGLALNP